MRKPSQNLSGGANWVAARISNIIMLMLCCLPMALTAHAAEQDAYTNSGLSGHVSRTAPATQPSDDTARRNEEIPLAALERSTKQEAPRTLDAGELTNEIKTYLEQAIAREQLPEGQAIDFTIEQLDLRIALNACSTPLEIKPYHQRNAKFAGRMTLQVTCQTPKPWRLFVPVNFKRVDRVVVPAYPLPRRTIIEASMLTYKKQDVSRLPNGYFRDKSSITGYETKQFIQQGHILSAHHLNPPTLIRRQQEVTIVSQSSRISVKAKGIALSDGKKGDRIKVRNKKSKRVIEVEVGEGGIVYASY